MKRKMIEGKNRDGESHVSLSDENNNTTKPRKLKKKNPISWLMLLMPKSEREVWENIKQSECNEKCENFFGNAFEKVVWPHHSP